MLEETKKQVREFYAGLARLVGIVVAVGTAWLVGLLIHQLFTQGAGAGEPVGMLVLEIAFGLIAALLLLNVRAEKPRDRDSETPD